MLSKYTVISFDKTFNVFCWHETLFIIKFTLKYKIKASPFYLTLIGFKVYVTTSTVVVLNSVFCIFCHVNTDHGGQFLLSFCINFITHLFLDESSLSPWQCSSWRSMNVLLDSLKSMTLIMCGIGNWIFQKPLWKMEGWDYNMKVLWWSVSSLPSVDVRSLKLSKRGRLITLCC